MIDVSKDLDPDNQDKSATAIFGVLAILRDLFTIFRSFGIWLRVLTRSIKQQWNACNVSESIPQIPSKNKDTRRNGHGVSKPQQSPIYQIFLLSQR